MKIPSNRQALEVTIQAPKFDTLAQHQIRDAFEIQIVQADGSPLSNRISSSRTAAFNWTDGYEPVSASGMWLDIAAPGQDSKVTFDLSEFPVGTEIRVLARLVNNDSDENTSVLIRGYEFVELPSTPPSVGSGVLAETQRAPVSAFDIRQLSDLTGLFEVDYVRTSLSTDKLHLVSQAELTNQNNSAILGPVIAVFENFSDPNVLMVSPDGFLQDGLPFIDLTGRMIGSALASGQSIGGPEVCFRNDSGLRFEYRLSVYGRVNIWAMAMERFHAVWTCLLAVSFQRAQRQATGRWGWSSVIFLAMAMPISPTRRIPTAVLELAMGGIALYEGDGSGATFTWSTAVNAAMSLAPSNVYGDARPIDLNGDGHLDLVFTGPGDWGNFAPGVNVAINDGAGKFSSTLWIDSNMGTHPQPSNLNNGLGVLVGDFNNDGMLDLLTARSGRPFTVNQFSSVSLMLADTPGTYRSAYDVRAQSAMWRSVSFVEYADFNNDGILDIWGPAYQNPSFTQLGNSDGTFQPPMVYRTGTIFGDGGGLHLIDLNADGNLDLVSMDDTVSQKTIEVRFGQGDGTFGTAQLWGTSEGTGQLAFGDLDNDGRIDIGINGNSRQEAVATFLGNRQGLSGVLAPRDSLSAVKPMIVTRPPMTAQAHQAYRYAVAATSPDGRTIQYSLSLAPSGMVIDANTGQIVWTPSGKQTGSQQVIVRAATDSSSVDMQPFSIQVAPANSAPVVTSQPNSPASAGSLWIYNIQAQDAEQSQLTFSLSVASDGATIDAETGTIRWTPQASQLGAHDRPTVHL